MNHWSEKLSFLATPVTNWINILAFSLAEVNGEDCRKEMFSIFTDEMDVNITQDEIGSAHSVGHPNINKPTVIIVRFIHRLAKEQIMAIKRELKGKHIGIAEDMTSANVKLLNRARNHDRVQDAWFVNGKIIAQTAIGEKHHLYLGCNIDKS